MDSMIAYKNRTYRYFGTAAARSDDAAGFIPARLCALAMIAAAFLLHFDGRNAWKIFRRDRYKHESPNSAQTESACAGALRVQLAGDSVYKGIVEHKPLLGDALRTCKDGCFLVQEIHPQVRTRKARALVGYKAYDHLSALVLKLQNVTQCLFFCNAVRTKAGAQI